MTELSKAVFLSYASGDAEAARRICEAFRAAGIEVWFDQSELRGGDAWDHHIRRQIADCALFVPIISAHTQARPEGYFRLEWDLADQRSHMIARTKAFIIPVCVDNTPDRGAEVPESFLKVQWTRMPGGEIRPAFVARVSSLLARDAHVAPAAAGAPATSSPYRQPTASDGSSSRLRLLMLVMVAAAVIAAGYFALDRFVLSKRLSQSDRAPPASVQSDTIARSKVPEKSIAVLPFVDMSEQKDQEYFGDGMAEEIINLLVKIPGLKVIGRTSSFQFKGHSEDLRTIGEKLGARYVLEGSVRKSGDQLRVTAQLITSSDGTHLWSQTYDRELSEVLKMQDEIAAKVARALQIEVSPEGIVARPALRNTEAYTSYLQGQHAFDRFDQQGFEQSASYYQRALDLDPSFAVAASKLAAAYMVQGEWGFIPPTAAFEPARRFEDLALKLEPNLADAHAGLGRIHGVYDWDWSAAEKELKLAQALAPNDARILFMAALQSLSMGNWDEALRQVNASLAQDPLNTSGYFVLYQAQLRRGRLAEAEAAIRRTLAISPTFSRARYSLGIMLLARGQPKAALAEMLKEEDDATRLGGSAMVYFKLGRKPDSDAALAQMLQSQGEHHPFLIAQVYAFRGEPDEAFKWLDRAYTQREAGLEHIKGEPTLKNLEGDPRYKAFLTKMNLIR